MSFSPTSRQVILQELFDESSEPTHEEIHEYALRIGINLDNEPYLLPLARDCLMQPLPPQWKPCYDEDRPDNIYYFNFKTGRAQWVNPLDEIHRDLVKKARLEAAGAAVVSSTDPEEDSRTTVKEDLKSFEETLPSESQSSEMINKPRLLEPLAPLQRANNRKPPTTLGPIKPAMPATNIDDRKDIRKVSFDEVEVKKRPNSSDIRNRRNIGPMEFRHLSKQEVMTPRSQWRDEGYATESSGTDIRRDAGTRELTLTGGGGMFLKKNCRKVEGDLSPKSILRKDSDEDLPPEREASKDDMDDDRKSVRFRLEKEIRVNFELPTASSGSDEPTSILSGVKTLDSNDFKQIEVDFDDLNLNDTIQVPKKTDNEFLVPADETKSSQKKSINIVLNENCSQSVKMNENLIDLTDCELKSDANVVTADAIKNEFDGFVSVAMKKNLFELETAKSLGGGTTRLLKTFPKRISDSELSSQSVDDMPSTSVREEINIVSTGGNVDRIRSGFEVARAEKLKELEGNFNAWVKSTENMFKEKEKQYYSRIKEKYEDWRKNQENEMIKEMSDLCAEESQTKLKALRNELLKEEQEAVIKLKAELTSQQQERLRVLRIELENREDMEIRALRRSLEDALSERKQELLRKHQEEVSRMEINLEAVLSEQRLQRQLEVDKARQDEALLLAKRAEMNDAFVQQKTVLEQEHELALEKLRKQQEVELRQVANTVKPPEESSLEVSWQRPGVNKESDPRDYEKLRCEKRLIEDKYKSLKEKYVRLKTDVKLTLERRIKKREAASASETDKSNSCKTNRADTESPHTKRKNLTDKKVKNKKQSTLLDNVNQNVSAEVPIGVQKNCEGRRDADGSSDDKRRRQLFSKLKAASTSRLHSCHRADEKDDAPSPVENLRRQLKKLEELEDQFPVTTHTDTYLRYPFTDPPAPHVASSELEFFKHRIHLERDSVRRAKEFLKTQKKCYEKRQIELQHRLLDGGPTSKVILDQIHQEERELTEMEVSVHRTRALLGEKIIRLRHLEQSLRRVTPDRRTQLAPRSVSREDGTLSDLSSHSDSSGFSSTHHTSEPVGPRPTLELNRRHLLTSMQESTEIIQSLENLNSEIRGIWEILKQQSSGPGAVTMPPPPLAWPAVRTNPAANAHTFRPLTQQIMTQVSSISNVGHVTTVVDPSLVDRTRSLRDWLKSTRRSPNPGDPAASNQVTL